MSVVCWHDVSAGVGSHHGRFCLRSLKVWTMQASWQLAESAWDKLSFALRADSAQHATICSIQMLGQGALPAHGANRPAISHGWTVWWRTSKQAVLFALCALVRSSAPRKVAPHLQCLCLRPFLQRHRTSLQLRMVIAR